MKREGCPSHGSGFPCGKGRAPLPLITHKSCFTITDPKPFEPDPISLGREPAHFLLLNHANLRLSHSQPVLTFFILSQTSQTISQFFILFSPLKAFYLSPHIFLYRFLDGGQSRKEWQKVKEVVCGGSIEVPGFPFPDQAQVTSFAPWV